MAIDASTILPITEHHEAPTDPIRDYYYPFGDFRAAFITDGTFGYHTLPKHFGSTKFLRRIVMHPLLDTIRTFDSSIPLSLPTGSYNAAIPVQNSASGAWFAPGDWGVKIHE